MERSGLFYLRFMDDILVLAPTRWKIRKAVKAVNEVLGSLRMEKHPDKTFIGRIERGFDFLGYHFGPEGLSVAKTTIEQFIERAIRLYEQEPGETYASARLGLYVRRWIRWVRAGLPSATLSEDLRGSTAVRIQVPGQFVVCEYSIHGGEEPSLPSRLRRRPTRSPRSKNRPGTRPWHGRARGSRRSCPAPRAAPASCA